MAKVIDKNNKEWREFDASDFVEVVKADGKKIAVFDKDKFKDYAIDKFTLKLNQDGYYEKLAKPNIPENKLLDENEGREVKVALWNCGLVDDVSKVIKEGRKLIFKELMPAKNDYKHDYDRGTVYYTTRNRNYSYSKVIIPDGTIIRNSNFTQRVPHTDAIQGENLTFIDCNCSNVLRHQSWINQGTSYTQIKRVLLSVGDAFDEQGNVIADMKKISVSYQFEKNPMGQPNVFTEEYVKERFEETRVLENTLRRYEGMI